jgi:hypothetical protein
MKKILFGIVALLILLACSTQKGAIKVSSTDTEEIAADSVEYDIETFDAKFETWYQMHNSPSMYRSQQYYEGWNKQYVNAWNINAMTGRRSNFFEPIVGYNPTTDYGFELNHELFYYFQYVEHVLKIQIIPGGGPRAVQF